MCLVSSEAHSINDGCFMISSQVLTNVDLRTGRFELDSQTNKGNRSDRANDGNDKRIRSALRQMIYVQNYSTRCIDECARVDKWTFRWRNA